jgi:hypothetical protein
MEPLEIVFNNLQMRFTRIVPHDITNFGSHDTANLKFQKCHKSLSNNISKLIN